MKRLLRDFTDDDFLLMIGDPAAMSIAAALASSYNGGKFKLLKMGQEGNEVLSH
jgi:hypothetical protein